ncbi:MAG: hypothetical protein WCO26_22165, partial [Deltaproteobacteria bacterium]
MPVLRLRLAIVVSLGIQKAESFLTMLRKSEQIQDILKNLLTTKVDGLVKSQAASFVKIWLP